MLRLNRSSLHQASEWDRAGIRLPKADIDEVIANTIAHPRWVHIGPGNIFRGYVAVLAQDLLDKGAMDSGVTVLSTFDQQVITDIYEPHDNLALQVIMRPQGDLDKRVVASVGEVLQAERGKAADWNRTKEIFRDPGLQMVSFTITEKGYFIQDMTGAYYPEVLEDFERGPLGTMPQNTMALVAALLHERFLGGAHPIAMVSMDNFSHNGDRLFSSVVAFARNWADKGHVSRDFVAYLEEGRHVTFPWSMIDKITPRPDETVARKLNEVGFMDTERVITDCHTYIAPYVNTEGPQYLVIEEAFPNGRPPLEKGGVYFTERKTVDLVERMKVCTCLNPLHTALAVFGCLLGYLSIAEAMGDPVLVRLIKIIGYREGMPVVADPGIFVPSEFLREVLEERFPNPYIPDTPQRIATDTSQKMPIRYGETLKHYVAREDLDVSSLVGIPLVIAGWCRYLLGVDDRGQTMDLSSDPLLPELRSYLAEVELGKDLPEQTLRPILSSERLFGSDLYEIGIAPKIEAFFRRMIEGPGAVRHTLDDMMEKER